MKKPLLVFEKRKNNTYEVKNHKGEFIADIEKLRVGRFMHWCLSPRDNTFFTNGCLKEITDFITLLYKFDKDNKKNDACNTN